MPNLCTAGKLLRGPGLETKAPLNNAPHSMPPGCIRTPPPPPVCKLGDSDLPHPPVFVGNAPTRQFLKVFWMSFCVFYCRQGWGRGAAEARIDLRRCLVTHAVSLPRIPETRSSMVPFRKKKKKKSLMLSSLLPGFLPHPESPFSAGSSFSLSLSASDSWSASP